jgi:hypothetical protein
MHAWVVAMVSGALLVMVTGNVNAHRDGEGPADPASATAPLIFDSAPVADEATGRLSWPHIFDAEGRFRSAADVDAASRRAAPGRGVAPTRPPVTVGDRPPPRQSR